MLKRILAIALFVPMFLWAKVPVEDDILEVITDPSGESYYPNLMLRFEMGDTTLTAEQYHYLYYGYIYREEYKPLLPNTELDELIALAAELNPDAPSVETLDKIVGVADKILRRDPFNPKVWNILSYAYGALGDSDKERAAYDRVNKILQTIDASGDGLKEKSPKHILMFDHAVDFMASQNLRTARAMVISRNVEFLPLTIPQKVDGKKFKGYYFDFSRVYLNKPDSVTYTRDRTWQFNNLKPREYK
ncbi:MAG: DUF4919 domain-containing protein [Rikenellaceae bacterium]